ncbi:hypothetical protein HYPSUDRAFT_163021 [Hypholoma sublateritium FD-334 SS-4]|uniref:Cytochrome P450 n=1 Tax=Hypholoma sublateritium (strain FD-334 SS-4) TaxID=945553 RepID=A0A0D2MJ82_HYPSF|nr:hypothetical protein HYPSUDRAFT_163021 [Hypholoma sublateritium FD-334 SS-4]
MDLANYLPAFVLAFALWITLFKKSKNDMNCISSLRGPALRSWIYGNMIEFMLEIPGGETASQWFGKYGNTFKFHACLGEEKLLTSDPTAIKHILSNPSVFGKSPAHQFINLVLFGTGSVLYAQGANHRRIRAVSNPMFSSSNVRSLTPLFRNIAQNLSDSWCTHSDSVIDVYRPIHLTTLRAITEAVMCYETTSSDEYTLAYDNLVLAIAQRTKAAVLTGAILSFLPRTVIEFLKNHPPSSMKKFRYHRMMARQISTRLLEEKRKASEIDEESNVNLFNKLVDTNDKAANKMTDDELHDQFGTLAIAGEDTTASTLLWILYALAVNPEWQDKLRREINNAFHGEPINELDYDKLPILNAVIKEVLRSHATIPFTERMASADATIPLADVVLASNGTRMKEIKVRKGQTVVISIMAYNRLSSIWGDDAHEFNPSRWLTKAERHTETASIGPYANLLSFLGGPRVCLGWRFAYVFFCRSVS